jgi:hypothetical protein
MMKASEPMRYHCIFEKEVLKEVKALALPSGINM